MTTVASPTARITARALAVGSTVAVGLLAWLAVTKVFGVELTADDGDGGVRTVGAASVALVAVVSALAGWAALALLERFARRVRRPGTVFAANASVALALSLIGPLTEGTTGAAKAGLTVVHALTGATLVVALARTARR